MIPHLIWRIAYRRVLRMALTAVALVVASGSVTLCASLAAMVPDRTEQALGEQRRGEYDILVRPVGSRTALEAEEGLLPPNHLNTLAGGITFAQFEEVRTLPGVEVAAPLATLGYYTLPISLRAGTDVASGAHAVHCISQGVGPTDPRSEQVYFHYYLLQDGVMTYGAYVPGDVAIWAGYPAVGCSFEHLALLSAVDPGAEAALMGLDGTTQADSFPIGAFPSPLADGERTGRPFPAGIPVLANASGHLESTLALRVEQVVLPPSGPGPADLEARGGSTYLQTLERGDTLVERTLDAGRFFSFYSHSLLVGHVMTAHLRPLVHGAATYAAQRAAPAREIEGHHLVVQYIEGEAGARQGQVISGQEVAAGLPTRRDTDSALPVVHGTFDLIGAAPCGAGVALLEAYGIPTATLRYDEEGREVQPTVLRNGLEPRAYLTPPPTLLTTLEAARTLRGEDAISAIRVRVAGVERLSPEALARIESVADEIARRTGLEVDVVTGSTTRQVLVHVPGVGYIEQTWIQRGEGERILAETQRTARRLATTFGGLCALLLVGVAGGRGSPWVS